METIEKNHLHAIAAVRDDACAFGFEWPNVNAIIEQAVSECAEIRSAIQAGESSTRIQEEIGDLLHVAIELCRFCNYDVLDTIEKTTTKFQKRMQIVKTLAKKQGLSTLHGQTIEFMLTLWDAAKKQSYSQS